MKNNYSKMSDFNETKSTADDLPFDSLIAINLEKILAKAENELNDQKYEVALKILLEAKELVEKNLQTLKSNLLLELKEKIMNLVSTAYMKMGRYDDCFENDKEILQSENQIHSIDIYQRIIVVNLKRGVLSEIMYYLFLSTMHFDERIFRKYLNIKEIRSELANYVEEAAKKKNVKDFEKDKFNVFEFMTQQSNHLFTSFCEYYKINLFNELSQPKISNLEQETPKEQVDSGILSANNIDFNKNNDNNSNRDSYDAALESDKKGINTPNTMQANEKSEDIIKEQNDDLNLIKIDEEEEKIIQKEIEKQEEIKEFKDTDSNKKEVGNQSNEKVTKNSLGNVGLGSILATIGVVSGLGFYFYMKFKK